MRIRNDQIHVRHQFLALVKTVLDTCVAPGYSGQLAEAFKMASYLAARRVWMVKAKRASGDRTPKLAP
jgi:hypothetical protein